MTALRPATADHIAMVGRIVATYESASDAQRRSGLDWYPAAGRMVGAIAESAGIAQYRVALALAALSPRNPWRWNVADAYVFAHAAAADPNGAGRSTADIPSATTFTPNRERAWRALTAEDTAVWTGTAPKVRSFVAAILGDVHAVVVDTWAIRVATGGAYDTVRGDAEYGAVAAAYQDAAVHLSARYGYVNARDVQAVAWVVAEQAGLGSRRRGRHGETFKAGTPPAVVDLFETVPFERRV
jgi:hypothetical protein